MFNGQRLRELMDANGVSQEKLSDVIGCTQKFVSFIERGLKRPNIEQVVRIADYFKVPVDELCIRSWRNISA